MKPLIRVTSPGGYDLGWISPELILRVRPPGHMIQFKDGDRVVEAYANVEQLKDLCGTR